MTSNYCVYCVNNGNTAGACEICDDTGNIPTRFVSKNVYKKPQILIRPRGAEIEEPDAYMTIQQDEASTVTEPAAVSSTVDHPAHYNQGGIECIEAIKACLTPEEYRGFLRGNSLKYAWRMEDKNATVEDVDKCIWYIKQLRTEYERMTEREKRLKPIQDILLKMSDEEFNRFAARLGL